MLLRKTDENIEKNIPQVSLDDVIDMVHSGGLTYEEVAEAFGVPVNLIRALVTQIPKRENGNGE